MATYTEHDQRMLDQQSGAEMDRSASRRRSTSDDPFEYLRETEEETQERWRAIRAKRKAEDKCWQCAKLIADCKCPNMSHKK